MDLIPERLSENSIRLLVPPIVVLGTNIPDIIPRSHHTETIFHSSQSFPRAALFNYSLNQDIHWKIRPPSHYTKSRISKYQKLIKMSDLKSSLPQPKGLSTGMSFQQAKTPTGEAEWSNDLFDCFKGEDALCKSPN